MRKIQFLRAASLGIALLLCFLFLVVTSRGSGQTSDKSGLAATPLPTASPASGSASQPDEADLFFWFSPFGADRAQIFLLLPGQSAQDITDHAPLSEFTQYNGAASAYWSDKADSFLISYDDDVYKILESNSSPTLLKLSVLKGGYTNPQWSPDATNMVFTSVDLLQAPDQPSLNVMVLSYDGKTHVVAGPYYRISAPQWSPNGQFIAFATAPSQQNPMQNSGGKNCLLPRLIVCKTSK